MTPSQAPPPPPPAAPLRSDGLGRALSVIAVIASVVAIGVAFAVPGPQGTVGTTGSQGLTGPTGPAGAGTIMSEGNSSYAWNVYDYNYCDRVLSQNISIAVPGPGTIIVQDFAKFTIYHWNGRVDSGSLYIENKTTNCVNNVWTSTSMVASGEASASFSFTMPVQDVFRVTSAGTYQYYLDVDAQYATVFGFGGASVDYSSWVAVFYPS